MSKWNRPMRAYVPVDLRCALCDRPIYTDKRGYWQHEGRKMGIKQPGWHLARPA